MLLIIINWMIIFFVLFSFGDAFVYCYNKICKCSENYNIVDTFILGLCVILIPLQALSLFFPSNQYVLFLFIALAAVYWLFAKGRCKVNLAKLKNIYISLSFFQKMVIIISVLAVIINSLTPYHFYDAEYYHFQNIKWNEQYAAIPGLANLEDRFGFNSNYLLISAIFTFSFLSFGTEVYVLLQSLLFFLIVVWGLVRLFKSDYDIKYIIILFLITIIYLLCSLTFRTSDTDIIPTLCVFYFFIKIVINQDSVVEKALFSIVLPISLITYKFSMIFFFIFGLLVIFNLIKRKAWGKIAFISTASFLILAFWCIRNVIISGYLVYPIYYIDIFSFDWKVPEAISKLQQIHIREWAYYVFKRTFHSSAKMRDKINLIIFFISILSLLSLVIKRVIPNKNLLAIGVCSFITILLCLINAPDIRFINGFIFGNLLIASIVIVGSKNLRFAKWRKYTVLIFPLCLFFITGLSTKLENNIDFLLLKPAAASSEYNNVKIYPLGNIFVFLTEDRDYKSFYTLPCTTLIEGVPFDVNMGNKIQNLRTIEARGESLQAGFKTQEKYIDILNRDVDKYISDYYKKKYNIVVE